MAGPDLAVFRNLVSTSLPDRCTIERPSTGGTLDPSTGVWTPAAATVVYSGPCLVRPASQIEQQRLFGGGEVTLQRFVAVLPYDAADIDIDDRFTLTSSTDLHGDDRRFHVAAVGAGSWAVDRRLGLEETAPS